jgi:Na+-translocating ferredoxin:NAD+ oxidoreductase subunit D
MEKKYNIGPSPHIRTEERVNTIMRDVIIALLPAMAAGIYFFGIKAAYITSVSVITAVITEAICQKIMNKKVEIMDGSAIITGILFSFTVTPTLPLWMAIIGSFVAIVLGKMVFGGLGHNIFNPALVGRAFLMASWLGSMTSWINTDGKAGATVLGILKMENYDNVVKMFSPESNFSWKVFTESPVVNMYWNMFIGNRGGSIGETSIVALLIGAAYLIYKKHITVHTPLIYIFTVFMLSWAVGQDPVMAVMAGGLVLGAFFMATDSVTTPDTASGKLIFGLGAGILVVLIRTKGGYPEGVCYSILIMNALTPLINRYIRPKVFGRGEGK